MVFLFFFFPHFLLSLSPSKKKKKGDIRQVATKLSKLVESVLRHIYLETRRELELQVTHLTKEERGKKKNRRTFLGAVSGLRQLEQALDACISNL